jgi:hypothetical protein
MIDLEIIMDQFDVTTGHRSHADIDSGRYEYTIRRPQGASASQVKGIYDYLAHDTANVVTEEELGRRASYAYSSAISPTTRPV